MMKKLFIQKDTTPDNLGKGTYAQAVLQLNTINKLVAHNPPKIKGWTTYKTYKTT